MKKQIKQIAKFSIISLSIALSLAVSAVLPHTSFAYTIPEDLRPINEPFVIEKELDPTKENASPNASATTGTIVFLQILAGGLLYFAAPVGIIIIAMTGFNMVFQGAESEKIEQSKRSLTWAIMGLLLIILSYSLVRIVINMALQAASS
ncbi:hypothetical protein M0P48_04020 [Candidatus Gracilibacteria bacterium]|nr:hypothetical protein [Candidatus Gracilibacteria bacterium]